MLARLDARQTRKHPIRRMLRRMAVAAMLLCVAFIGGFVVFTAHVSSLETPRELQAADAIIVLTGGVARIDAAVELLQAGLGRRLLISGVNPVAQASDLQRATGAAPELFECCVDIDHNALDTIGNATESAKWLERNAFTSAIVVTNNYHMPRSLIEMRRALREAVLIPYPVIADRGSDQPGFSRDALRVLLTEYLKLIATIVRTTVLPSGEEAPPATIVEAGAWPAR